MTRHMFVVGSTPGGSSMGTSRVSHDSNSCCRCYCVIVDDDDDVDDDEFLLVGNKAPYLRHDVRGDKKSIARYTDWC